MKAIQVVWEDKNGEADSIFESSEPYRKDGSFRSFYTNAIKEGLEKGFNVVIIQLSDWFKLFSFFFLFSLTVRRNAVYL